MIPRTARREVADVPEPRPPDRRLDQLLHVRKQRLRRFERERNEARQAWRAERSDLAACKERWRHARDEAHAQWQAARTAFSQMTITSGDFKKAKAVYARMKQAASQLRVEWQECRQACRIAGAAFFAARQVVLEANRQQEKLGLLRDALLAERAMAGQD